VFANEEDMLLLETAGWLLGHLSGSKGLAVNKLARSVDGFKARFHFVRDIFNSHKVNLERVKLLAKVLREQWLVRLHFDIEVVDSHGLQLIKFPFEFHSLSGEQEA
jgi:hypothetical protein